MRPIIAHETSLSAMCGRLRIRKNFVHARRLRSNDEWSPVCYGALDPPVGGTFHFENLIMPPLTKTCPKMVLSDKGGSLCVKDAFEKKFLVPGEIPRAARSHRFFGNTLVKAGHLMRPSVVSGTVRGLAPQGGQGLAAPMDRAVC